MSDYIAKRTRDPRSKFCRLVYSDVTTTDDRRLIQWSLLGGKTKRAKSLFVVSYTITNKTRSELELVSRATRDLKQFINRHRLTLVNPPRGWYHM